MVNRVLKSICYKKKVLVCKGENYCFRVLTEWKEILKLFLSKTSHCRGTYYRVIIMLILQDLVLKKLKKKKRKTGQVSKQIKKYC